MRSLIFLVGMWSGMVSAECDSSMESLNRYEQQILQAVESDNMQEMAAPLSCVMKMQSEGEGIDRYMSSSYLRPMLGGEMVNGVSADPRLNKVARALEKLTAQSSDVVQKSFVAEFSKGDWRFYSLFCEQGNTQYCSIFLPDESKVKSEPPLLAAASMLRLRKAYQVLTGKQRDLVADRLKNLYRDITPGDRLRRKFIEQIYNELFPMKGPLSLVS